ncbi:MAG: hypothetical protein Q4D30_10995 [Bacteroidales bacterium]|nr:hypothetical protein [Bacteroidales bacterium]
MNNKNTIYYTDCGIGAADAIAPLNQWQDDDIDDVQSPAKKSHELEYLENVWSNYCLYRHVKDALSKRLLLAATIFSGMTALSRFYDVQGNTLLLPLDVNWEVWKTRMVMICKGLKGIKLPVRNGFQSFLREKTLPFESEVDIDESDSAILDDMFEMVFEKESHTKGMRKISINRLFGKLAVVLNDLWGWFSDDNILYEDIYNGIISQCNGDGDLAEQASQLNSAYDDWHKKNGLKFSKEILQKKMMRERDILKKSPIKNCVPTVFNEEAMAVNQKGVGDYIVNHWDDMAITERPTIERMLHSQNFFHLLRLIVMDSRISKDLRALESKALNKESIRKKQEKVPQTKMCEEHQCYFKDRAQIPMFEKLVNEKICTYINTDGEKWEWDIVMYVCKGLNIINRKLSRKHFASMIEEICPEAKKILSSMSNPKEPTKDVPFDSYKQYARVEPYISRYVEILKPLENA